MNNVQVDYSIIIVSYNTRDLLRNGLDSIYKSQGDITYEVIVVDNNSVDGSVEMIKDRFDLVKLVVNSDNRGFAKACNQGIRMTCGKYIVLLNSDIEVFPETFHDLKQFISNDNIDPRIGIVSCKIQNTDGSLQYSFGNFPTLWSTFKDMFRPHYKRKYSLHGYNEPHEVDWATGAFMIIDRRIIEDIGPMDENYFMYYEEVDYCLQAKKKGWKIFYYPVTGVIHRNPLALKHDKASKKILAEIRRSHLYYYRKNLGYMKFITLFLATMTLLSLKYLSLYVSFGRGRNDRQNKKSQVKYLIVSVWDAFRSLNKYEVST